MRGLAAAAAAGPDPPPAGPLGALTTIEGVMLLTFSILDLSTISWCDTAGSGATGDGWRASAAFMPALNAANSALAASASLLAASAADLLQMQPIVLPE